ncbi:hypothetical protein DdX_17772 [Ditylenchus destructor]|uniref:Uncharacterized protein n=1 Tax=Ditylenchus destructor TaxID=166010 RepID=A0AAD4MMF7_9BILA|nr:hypothetical protein DdX_17772 [Ditylenchus destructor]
MSLYGTSNKSFAQSPTLTEIFSHPNPGVCPALLCLTGRHWRSRASLKDPLRGRHSAGAACGSLNISKGNFSKPFFHTNFRSLLLCTFLCNTYRVSAPVVKWLGWRKKSTSVHCLTKSSGLEHWIWS